MNRISLGLLALALSGLAQAQSIYSSGSPNSSTVWDGDASNPNATWAAAEFTLASGASITGANWWGGFDTANAASATDSFKLDIYSATSGTVGSLIASFNLGNAGETATGNRIQLASEYAYSGSFAPIVLGSGTYFLAIQRTGTSGIWGWETTNGTGLEAYQNSAGAWFSNPGVNLAFSLSGVSAVPEESTSLMLLCGFAAVGLVKALRRRRGWPPLATGLANSA